jgi:surfactin synthase thioesterase subunit
METNSWFVFFGEQNMRKVQFRLFCFHYAGSGGSIFRPWRKWLSEQIELVAVQLPGRETRWDEPLLHSMKMVTEPLTDALLPLLDKPFAFFGHSTGAAISFELTRELRRREMSQPKLLIMSGQNAPAIKPEVIRHGLSDREFTEVIRNCNGTPDVVLTNPGLLELLLPRIRADGALYETYCYEQQAPMDSRIVVFHGFEDKLVSSVGLDGWRTETKHSFDRYTFPGGHFYLHEVEEDVVLQINRELEPFLSESICL